jgi:hypothetical protein
MQPMKLIDVFKILHKDSQALASRFPVTLKKRRLSQTLTVSKLRVFYDNDDSMTGTVYEEPEVCLVVRCCAQTTHC